ncbi:MAG: sigma-70 family RNA polymerase sigma factor [Planctomycetota bacterium]
MDSLSVFEVLVRENGKMLDAFIRALVSDSGAVDDVWQETMITAWKRWDDYDRNQPFGAWLRGIARNHIKAHYRKQNKQPVSMESIEYVESVFGKLRAQFGDSFDQRLELLRACVEKLPSNYSEVIKLRFKDAMKPAEIAESTSQKLETIKKRLLRAKSDLYDCMARKLATQE